MRYEGGLLRASATIHHLPPTQCHENTLATDSAGGGATAQDNGMLQGNGPASMLKPPLQPPQCIQCRTYAKQLTEDSCCAPSAAPMQTHLQRPKDNPGAYLQRSLYRVSTADLCAVAIRIGADACCCAIIARVGESQGSCATACWTRYSICVAGSVCREGDREMELIHVVRLCLLSSVSHSICLTLGRGRFLVLPLFA